MNRIVDTIKIDCKELFTIRFDHVGYETSFVAPGGDITNSTIFQDITIEPDSDTKVLFRNQAIGLVQGNNMLICFIRKTVSTPLVPLSASARIRLLLQAGANFFKKTNITQAGSKQVYVFTNKERTGDASNRFLTKNNSGASGDDLAEVSSINPEENCLAVIDIYANESSAAYRLLNGDQLESPPFRIQFMTN